MSLSEARRHLATIPGWTLIRGGRHLLRTVRLPIFPKAISLVVAVGRAAERMDHHPDMDIRYRRVRFRLSSHDAGGLTMRDFRLARTISRLAVRHRATA